MTRCACGRTNPGGCEVRGCYWPRTDAASSVSAGTKFRCERCGAVLAAVSAGAGQVPAAAIEKARRTHGSFEALVDSGREDIDWCVSAVVLADALNHILAALDAQEPNA